MLFEKLKKLGEQRLAPPPPPKKKKGGQVQVDTSSGQVDEWPSGQRTTDRIEDGQYSITDPRFRSGSSFRGFASGRGEVGTRVRFVRIRS